MVSGFYHLQEWWGHRMLCEADGNYASSAQNNAEKCRDVVDGTSEPNLKGGMKSHARKRT